LLLMSEKAKQIKIGVITNSVTRAAGGMFFSIREPRLKLLERNVVPHIFSILEKESLEDLSLWHPLSVNVFPHLGSRRFGYSPQLKRAVLSTELDVLHLHGIWNYTSLVALKWKQKFQRPFVVSPHGMLDSWALAHSGWKKKIALSLFQREVLESATCWHALNLSEAEAIRSLGFQQPIAIIPNGVSEHAAINAANAQSSPQVDQRRILLYLGRLHKKKGILELIEAWSILRQTHPNVAANWKIQIAGWSEGGYEHALKDAIRGHRLESDVTLVGPVFERDKDAALRNASAFVLPSFSEGLPMSVLEAWSYELPVFMTHECNLPESFINGGAIEITTNPSQMASTLANNLTNEIFLKDVGRIGKITTQEKYSWDVISFDYRALYLWIIGAGPKPAFLS
jgi:glycosyltransferase involved in cell wall biosynthesis